jgi:SHS2 domain-containing protein
MLVKTADILSLSENDLSATVKFDQYAPDRHIIKTEIKAVTYHQIQVISGPSGWDAKIIFDV